MDGRDVGTVIFPRAYFKFFLDADLDVRSKRRYVELRSEKGLDVDEGSVRKEMARRDNADSTRRDSPLKKAEDALCLDTSNMTPMDVVMRMEKIIFSKVKKKKGAV